MWQSPFARHRDAGGGDATWEESKRRRESDNAGVGDENDDADEEVKSVVYYVNVQRDGLWDAMQL